MKRKLVTIIMIFMIITLPIITLATTESEINEKKNEAQNNLNAAEERRNEISGDISTARAELSVINDEIAEKEYEIEKITAELNALNTEIATLKTQIGDAQEQYDEKFDMLSRRLAAQYKAGSVSYLDVLLNSSNLTDFISNYYLIEKIAEMDSQLLEDIDVQKKELEISKKSLETKQSEVSNKEKQLQTEKIILQNKKSTKNQYISKLSEEDKKLQKDIDEYNEMMKQYDRELQEFAKQQAGNSGGNQYTGGTLQWPCPNYTRISSYFGYRGSAATGGVGTANHNGYDLAAPHYSSIVAAEKGTVVKVIRACSHDYPKTAATKCNCGGGYGNYVMVSHGNLVTLYGHCSSISVNVGDVVTRGQEIAKVGSCGWSTGYHLHFSVILNGIYVNPGDYF